MHNHRRLGLNHELFMFLSPEADLVDDGQAHILYINAPGVVVIEEEDRKEYLEFMVDIAMMLGAQRYRADIEMRKTLDFMADLRKVRAYWCLSGKIILETLGVRNSYKEAAGGGGPA